ncbi:MAG: hypothetical protein AABY15_03900 [Nanoarchaeota archaeon]
MQNYVRWAPSLGELAGTHQEAWGTESYDWRRHRNEPTCFLGMYDLRDYLALWRHKGRKWILWCGSDLLNLWHNFLFNDGKLQWLSRNVRFWSVHRKIISIINLAENWTENETEASVLRKLGIKVSGICPSFLGNIKNYSISYKHSFNPKVYVSCSGDKAEMYGFDIVERIAPKTPQIFFHLFGSNIWQSRQKNIICRGWIPKDQMNEEIKNMQCGLRLNEFDGFSEVCAKSILWGQYPIGKVKHPYIPSFNTEEELVALLNELSKKTKPNSEARDWYVKNLNCYPWVHAKI